MILLQGHWKRKVDIGDWYYTILEGTDIVVGNNSLRFERKYNLKVTFKYANILYLKTI